MFRQHYKEMKEFLMIDNFKVIISFVSLWYIFTVQKTDWKILNSNKTQTDLKARQTQKKRKFLNAITDVFS
jgi:hypothetical protein